MKNIFLALALVFTLINMSFSQIYTNKEVGKKK
jgi:hypothetical protein